VLKDPPELLVSKGLPARLDLKALLALPGQPGLREPLVLLEHKVLLAQQALLVCRAPPVPPEYKDRRERPVPKVAPVPPEPPVFKALLALLEPVVLREQPV